MADNNNDQAANLPSTPHPMLKKLNPLVGKWKQSGGWEGVSEYQWMDGGFFMVQTFSGGAPDGSTFSGVEYIGYDPDTDSLRSMLFDSNGSKFVYTYDIDDSDPNHITATLYFGGKDSDNFLKGEFSKDHNKLTGNWQWPEGDGKIGGYPAELVRIDK